MLLIGVREGDRCSRVELVSSLMHLLMLASFTALRFRFFFLLLLIHHLVFDPSRKLSSFSCFPPLT